MLYRTFVRKVYKKPVANLRKIYSYIVNVTVPDFGYRKRKHKDTEEVREHPKAESGNPDGVNKLQNAYSASMSQNGVNEETDENTKSKKKQKDKKRKEQMKAR